MSAYLSRMSLLPANFPILFSKPTARWATLLHRRKLRHRREATPAVPIKKSVTDDFIVCLEDGKSFKSLKRHLMAKFALTPEQYREKWKLPPDYPMVAPNYAQKGSELARATAWERNRRQSSPVSASGNIGLKFG